MTLQCHYGLAGARHLLTHPAALVLPVLVLLSRPVCSPSRLVRAGMIDALASPYVAQARRYGISGVRIQYGHALPDAIAPAAQQLARTVVCCCAGSTSWSRCT